MKNPTNMNHADVKQKRSNVNNKYEPSHMPLSQFSSRQLELEDIKYVPQIKY